MWKKMIARGTPLLLAVLFIPVFAAQTPEPEAGKAGTAAAPVRGGDYVFAPLFRANPDPADYADPVKASALFQRRETAVRNLLDERRKIIREDARAGRIRAQIRKLADELTVIVESRESVKKLTRALAELDSEIDALPPREIKPDGKKDTSLPAPEIPPRTGAVN